MDGPIAPLFPGPSSGEAKDDVRLPDEHALPSTSRVRKASIYWRAGNCVLATVAAVVLALVVWNQS